MAKIQPGKLPDLSRLISGHYHERRGYRVDRPVGIRDWILIYTLSGAGRFYCGDRVLPTAAHDVVVLRQDTPHGYETDEATGYWELLWTHFLPRPSWEDWLHWPEPIEGVMHLSLRDERAQREVVAALFRTHELNASYLHQHEELGLNAVEAALLWCDEYNPQRSPAKLDERVRRAVDYLCRHFAEPVMLPLLARACSLSPSWLSTVFHEQVGVSPMQFLEQRRIARARELLEVTGRPISQIAGEVGYQNPFYFTLRFKKATGMSPRDYRKARSTSR